MINPAVRVYSEAFFELSKEKNNLDIHKKDLNEVNNILKEYSQLNRILTSPSIEKEAKKEVFSEVFKDLEKDALNLAFVLIDKSRFSIFEDLTREFNKKYNEEKNIEEGIVYSIKELTESQMKDLENVLNKKFDKKVELVNKIDESLIGGISIELEGKRIDNSIKNRLTSLKAHLMKEGE